eukprot:6865007-Alexandrium_andersonii.AAC.1
MKASSGVCSFLCVPIVGPFLGPAHVKPRAPEAILHVPAWRSVDCGGVQRRRAMMGLRKEVWAPWKAKLPAGLFTGIACACRRAVAGH